MKCPDCKVKLETTHTFSAGDAGRTATRVCPKCKTKFTSVTILFRKASKYGAGASATAKRLEKACQSGKDVVDLQGSD